MDDTTAIEILMTLAKQHPLTETEKEAVSTAIGFLSWTKLSEGRMKALKASRNKKTQ